MACHVSLVFPGGRILERGQRPSKPSIWSAEFWLVLPSGEKHRHTCKTKKVDAFGLVAYMDVLLDSLLEDHGREVASIGWSASTRG